ncbi:hypothetical protein ACSBR2_033435 [Camellia fascicularis]
MCVKLKRSKHSHEGKIEFLAELTVIASLRHKNLVQLQGWSVEKDELLLVYEFMPNGSLDQVLYDQSERGIFIDKSYLERHRERTGERERKTKTEHLLALDGAKERLHLFKGNLLEEGSFDSMVNGCDGVFHTASPCFVTTSDPQKELIDPALKGTLNVLGSCTKSPTVKRVVLTSSMAAVECIGRPRTPNEITDETWFSNPEFCKENKLWYHLSKTLAEDTAWKFAKEKCIDMVVINPSMVIGPLLQPTLNASSATILELINGSQTYPNVSYGWINFKDVANAHIQAYEIPSASGRYCLVERVAHFSEVVKILHELYLSFQLPKK